MPTSAISSTTQTLIEKAITDHQLPKSFTNIVHEFYFPIAEELNTKLNDKSHQAKFIGVQGSQGSGKSTFAYFQKIILENEFNKNTLVISIDDFYLTKTERKTLAKTIHPLLRTRGVPGTHNIELLNQTFNLLKMNKTQSEPFYIPTFDKAIDDRSPKSDWQYINSNIDVVILEGWCVGISAQKNSELTTPVNTLESEEDQNMIWRKYVNQQLNNAYKHLYSQLDFQISLLAPSFECVYKWRLLQEKKMIKKLQAKNQDTSSTLNPEQINRFIAHYQRLTEHAFTDMPNKANWVLRLNADHTFQRSQKCS